MAPAKSSKVDPAPPRASTVVGQPVRGGSRQPPADNKRPQHLTRAHQVEDDALTQISQASSTFKQAQVLRICLPRYIVVLHSIALVIWALTLALPGHFPGVGGNNWTPAIAKFGVEFLMSMGVGVLVVLALLLAWPVLSVFIICFFRNRKDDEAAANPAMSLLNCCAGNCFFVIHWVLVAVVSVFSVMWFAVLSAWFVDTGTRKFRPASELGWIGLGEGLVVVSLYVASLRLHRIWKNVVAEQDDVREQFRQAYENWVGDPRKQRKYVLDGFETAQEAMERRWGAITDFFNYNTDPTDIGGTTAAAELGPGKSTTAADTEAGYLDALWDLWQRDPETARHEAEQLPDGVAVEGVTIFEWLTMWENGGQPNDASEVVAGDANRPPNLAERRRMRMEIESKQMQANDHDAIDVNEAILLASTDERPEIRRRDKLIYSNGKFVDVPRKNATAELSLRRLRRQCTEYDGMRNNDRDVTDEYDAEYRKITAFRARTDELIYIKGAYLDTEKADHFNPERNGTGEGGATGRRSVADPATATGYFGGIWEWMGLDGDGGADAPEEMVDAVSAPGSAQGYGRNAGGGAGGDYADHFDDGRSSAHAAEAQPLLARETGASTRRSSARNDEGKRVVGTRKNEKGQAIVSLKELSKLDQDKYRLDAIAGAATTQEQQQEFLAAGERSSHVDANLREVMLNERAIAQGVATHPYQDVHRRSTVAGGGRGVNAQTAGTGNGGRFSASGANAGRGVLVDDGLQRGVEAPIPEHGSVADSVPSSFTEVSLFVGTGNRSDGEDREKAIKPKKPKQSKK
ncbi:unnamed protein product [Amoebophrya sp. A25]|nr:unnamed protein product [Amoebophrya sp. A25]|eukprot:GSA25T00013770001.1